MGDLAAQPVDAVVRVVPPSRRRVVDDELGVLRAAGPRARDALDELLRLELGSALPPGRALTTTAGDLPARWLVHLCAPAYRVAARGEHVVAAGYRAVLAAADGLGARTLALAPIGMTLPYWPLDVATRLVASTLGNSPTRVHETTLVVRTPAALDVLEAALAR